MHELSYILKKKLDQLKKGTLNQILTTVVPLQAYMAKFDLVQLCTIKKRVYSRFKKFVALKKKLCYQRFCSFFYKPGTRCGIGVLRVEVYSLKYLKFFCKTTIKLALLFPCWCLHFFKNNLFLTLTGFMHILHRACTIKYE